jgi:hypothetical protein
VGDKEVVGVFVRFSCAASGGARKEGGPVLRALIAPLHHTHTHAAHAHLQQRSRAASNFIRLPASVISRFRRTAH